MNPALQKRVVRSFPRVWGKFTERAGTVLSFRIWSNQRLYVRSDDRCDERTTAVRCRSYHDAEQQHFERRERASGHAGDNRKCRDDPSLLPANRR
jgi:hypothetical protein